MLLAGVIGLVVYNTMATIRHPKAFAVEQTAAIVTSIRHPKAFAVEQTAAIVTSVV